MISFADIFSLKKESEKSRKHQIHIVLVISKSFECESRVVHPINLPPPPPLHWPTPGVLGVWTILDTLILRPS